MSVIWDDLFGNVFVYCIFSPSSSLAETSSTPQSLKAGAAGSCSSVAFCLLPDLLKLNEANPVIPDLEVPGAPAVTFANALESSPDRRGLDVPPEVDLRPVGTARVDVSTPCIG